MSDAVRVLIATPLEPELVARISAVDPRIQVIYEPGLLPVPRYEADHEGTPRDLTPADQQRWSELRGQADVSFDFDWQDPAGMAGNCPELRWVQATSAGMGGFMQRSGLDQTGLIVTTAAGVHAIPLAEFALTGLLYFAKNLPQLRGWQEARHWERYTSVQLSGRRVLLIGLGGIGREVARLLSCAGVEVWGAGGSGHTYDIPGVHTYVSSDELAAALPAMSGVVIACPLTEHTRGLIGAAELALLPRGAVVVNIGRGPVVDQDALTAELENGHLGGAFLDVFAAEPLPQDSPLWGMANVVVSPHSASTVDAENALLTDLFCDNLQRWLSGRELRNVYDRSAGY